jgi:TM2 domain-containing membrane protein YozV
MSIEPNPNPGEGVPPVPPVTPSPDIPVEVSPQVTPVAPADPAGPGLPPGAPISKEERDKKVIAGILGIVLGVFGVHKFYLGYQMEGIIMLVVSVIGFFLCGLPSTAIAVIGLVEGILYLTKPDEEFVKTYVRGRKPWF